MKPSKSKVCRYGLFAAVLATVLCPVADAATWFAWKGGSGNWSDKSHWDEGRVPVSGDIVVQFTAGTVATVNVDTNVTCNYLRFSSSASAENGSVVHLVGTNTIRTTATSRTDVGTHNKLIIDGITMTINKHIGVLSNATVEVRSGTLHISNGLYGLEGGNILLTGGRIESSLYLSTGSSLSVTGGVLHTYSGFDVASGAKLDFTGGVLVPDSTFPTSGYGLNVKSTLDIKTSKNLSLGNISVCDGGRLFMTNSTGTVTAKKVVVGDGSTVRMTSTLRFCEGLSIGDGSEFDMSGSSGAIRVRKLTMGDGSRLNLKVGGFLEPIFEPVLAETARIAFVVPEGGPTAHKLAPVYSSHHDAVPQNVEISGLDEETWTVKTVRGVRYLSDGYDPGVSYSSKEWIGTNSSTWSVAANWSGNSVLSGSSYGYFGRDLNPFVTNDAARTLRYPIFLANSGPYFIAGKQLSPTYGANKDTSNTIRHLSPFPVIFDNYLVAGSDTMAYFRNTANSFLLMRGGGKVKGAAVIHGDVRFGGVWTAKNIVYNSETTRGSRLTVSQGGTFTLTRPDGTFASPSRLDIFGIFETSNTLASVASTANWRGTGVVKLHGVDKSKSAAFTLGDSLSLYPMDGWVTVSVADPSNAVTIAATETPVLGATRDWTYGPETGAVPMMSEAARALTVAADSTLTINTQDPETSEGHTIAFEDPIVGEGNVVKAGAGTLLLATTNSVIGGSFRVTGGALAVSDEIFARAEKRWTTVMSAKSFEGVPAALPATLRSRVTAGEDGSARLQVRTYNGMTVIIF